MSGRGGNGSTFEWRRRRREAAPGSLLPGSRRWSEQRDDDFGASGRAELNLLAAPFRGGEFDRIEPLGEPLHHARSEADDEMIRTVLVDDRDALLVEDAAPVQSGR